MTSVRVIVVGGSAGAVDVLLALMPVLEVRSAQSVVIVVHRRPAQPSLLPRVLAPACRWPVRDAFDKAPLTAGVVFVAPPDYHLLLERDLTLALSRDPPVHFSRPSIDVTFDSAADALGARVAAIVLTGANEDGAAGAAAIMRAGGRVAVQDPATAYAAEMPRAAIAACTPELVADPEHIATWMQSLLTPAVAL